MSGFQHQRLWTVNLFLWGCAACLKDRRCYLQRYCHGCYFPLKSSGIHVAVSQILMGVLSNTIKNILNIWILLNIKLTFIYIPNSCSCIFAGFRTAQGDVIFASTISLAQGLIHSWGSTPEAHSTRAMGFLCLFQWSHTDGMKTHGSSSWFPWYQDKIAWSGEFLLRDWKHEAVSIKISVTDFFVTSELS